MLVAHQFLAETRRRSVAVPIEPAGEEAGSKVTLLEAPFKGIADDIKRKVRGGCRQLSEEVTEEFGT